MTEISFIVRPARAANGSVVEIVPVVDRRELARSYVARKCAIGPLSRDFELMRRVAF